MVLCQQEILLGHANNQQRFERSAVVDRRAWSCGSGDATFGAQGCRKGPRLRTPGVGVR